MNDTRIRMSDHDAFCPRSRRTQLKLPEGQDVHDPGNRWQCWGVVHDRTTGRTWQCNCRKRSPVAGVIRTCHRHRKLEVQAQAVTPGVTQGGSGGEAT